MGNAYDVQNRRPGGDFERRMRFLAWGLGEIGGKLLQKGVESAVTGKAPQNTPTVQQEVINQTLQSTDAANAQDPNSVEGVATNVASDVATNAATNALQNSGVPGAAAIGGVAGGLVKGFGGCLRKSLLKNKHLPHPLNNHTPWSLDKPQAPSSFFT